MINPTETAGAPSRTDIATAASAHSRINLPLNLENWLHLDDEVQEALMWFHQHLLDHPTSDFASDGTPPASVYIPMGKITAVAGAVTLQNSGTGSVLLALYNTGEQYVNNGSSLIVSRAIGYWRTGSANE